MENNEPLSALLDRLDALEKQAEIAVRDPNNFETLTRTFEFGLYCNALIDAWPTLSRALREREWMKSPDEYVQYVMRPFVITKDGKYWLVFRDRSGFLHYWDNDFGKEIQCVDDDWEFSIGFPSPPKEEKP